MSVRISHDQLDEASWSARSGGHERTAVQFLRWAEDVDAGSEVGRAELLVAAADQYGFAGSLDRRIELCRRAVEDGGRVHPDARCYLVAALLAADRADEAAPLIDALRRESGRHVHVDAFLGETLEAAGRYAEAAALFTAGHARAERTAPDEALLLLQGRRRCREALGLPSDTFDLLARRTLAQLRAEPGVPRQGHVEPLPGEPEREILVFVPEHDWDDHAELLGAGFADFDEQCAFIEAGLRRSGEGLPRVCVGVDTEGLLAHAAALGRDVEDGDVRLAYGLSLVRAGEGRSWPPGRNDPCWCGRDRKYKRCCGRPGAATG